MTTLFAFLHHLCAFTVVSTVAIEFVLVRQVLTLSSARTLQVIDIVYGVAAGALLVIGLLRVFYFEKGADYYLHSYAFLMKFALFVIVAILSIIPTREFLSWDGALKAGEAPAVVPGRLRLVTGIIRAELLGLAVIVLCAAIMARGGWV